MEEGGGVVQGWEPVAAQAGFVRNEEEGRLEAAQAPETRAIET